MDEACLLRLRLESSVTCRSLRWLERVIASDVYTSYTAKRRVTHGSAKKDGI